MKKFISAIAAVSLILAYFCTFGAVAAEEPTIYYSVDKSRWFELPMAYFTGEASVKFYSGQKNAKVYTEDGKSELNILDKVQFMYMYVEAPEGSTCDIYTTIDTSESQEPWSSLVDGGEWAWKSESKYAQYPVKLTSSKEKGDEPETAVAIPLRLGRVEIYIVCTVGSSETVYKVSAKGRWTAVANAPQISDTNGDFRVYTGSAAGYAILMNGASVANDNQTYLFTNSKYRLPGASSGSNWDEKEMWVGANFSKWLEGSSYVMMPGLGMAKNHQSFNDVSEKFFDLSFPTNYSWSSGDKSLSGVYGADYIGEIIMLMANRADGASVYYQDSAWECVNPGLTPADGASEFSPTSHPRNYNDYDDSDSGKYYGVAIKWNNKNGYRENSPAISESISSTHYNDYEELKYAYRRKFKAGETVSIYSPGNIEGTDEKYGLIIPVIKYYIPDETVGIKDIEAKYFASGDGVPAGGGVAVKVTTLLDNFTHGRKITAIYALYDDDGALSGVETKSQEAKTTSDEFIFACDAGRAKFLNVTFICNGGLIIPPVKVQINP